MFVSHRGTESTEVFNKLCALCDSVRECIGLWAEPTLDRHAYFFRLFPRRSTRFFLGVAAIQPPSLRSHQIIVRGDTPESFHDGRFAALFGPLESEMPIQRVQKTGVFQKHGELVTEIPAQCQR